MQPGMVFVAKECTYLEEHVFNGYAATLAKSMLSLKCTCVLDENKGVCIYQFAAIHLAKV